MMLIAKEQRIGGVTDRRELPPSSYDSVLDGDVRAGQGSRSFSLR
jgi:hypothetical protein